MRKSLVDSIEIALVELQYAMADYYSCSEVDRAREFGDLNASLRLLYEGIRTTQLAIGLLRQTPASMEKFSPAHR
jgi:hypothetical protein